MRELGRSFPGLLAVALAVMLAVLLSRTAGSLSPLTVALILGVALGNLPIPFGSMSSGLTFASSRLLRAGVVLLGLRLAIPDVLGLGGHILLVVMLTTMVTFLATQWLGRRIGLDTDTSLLVATGFAICGASAVAAMAGALRKQGQEVVVAVAVVTLFGSLAMVVLPVLQNPLGLSDAAFGAWAGASVTDVGQTVATASVVGPVAVTSAVLVKLTRVVLLAPLVAGVALWRRDKVPMPGRKPPVVPLFVLGFLAMVVLRSTGLLPGIVLNAAREADTLLLAAALFGLGSTVRLRVLLSASERALPLGLASWLFIVSLTCVGVLLTTG